MKKGIVVLVAILLPVMIVVGAATGVLAGVVVLNSSDESDSIITEEVQIERLEITDSDCEILCKHIEYSLGIGTYDVDTTPYENIIVGFIFNVLGLEGYYDVIFERPEGIWLSRQADPLGKFTNIYYGAYIVVPEENVKWLVENVFNREYQADFEASNYYVYEGNAYFCYGAAGDRMPEYHVAERIRLDDGRYELILKGIMDGIFIDEIKVTCDIRNTDNIRHMSFYKIEYTYSIYD